MAELSGLTGWKLLKAIRGRKDAVHNNEGVAIVSRHDADGTTYVRLPGSTFDTPVNGTSVVATEMGDEVSYTIRDGRLSITGSTSNPAVGASQVQNSIHQVETTVENIRTAYIEADQVQAKELAAERARIGELEADNVTINGKLDAAEANITNLQATALTADSATITDLQADTAKVHNLTADQLSTATAYVGALTAEGVTAQDVIADHGDFDTVKANAAKVENLTAAELEADHAKVGRIDVDQIAADHATVGTINADYLKAADMQAEQARVGTLLAGKADVTDLTAATARIGDLEADHVSVDDFEAEQGYIDALQAATADIATIRADSAKVHSLTAAQLSAATAYIAALNADNITAASLSADVGKIHNLTANEISAAAAYIAALNADSVTAQNIIAMNGDFATVKANAAKVANLTAAQLEADHATVGSLDANYAQINMANVNNAWIANGTIKDGAISNGMINSVSANKLTAGTIDASNITVTNLNADNITTGTINGQRIGEGSLSLSKLEEDVYTETEVNNIVSNLQTQIDGAIETWTGTAVPTLSNSPASGWTTNAIKDTHVGDVYFVVNSQSQQNGYNYRFTKSGNTYSWQLIKDSDVTNALQRLTTAEGKITTFDSDISQLKTDTGSLTTRTTSLETRADDVDDALLDKVDTTTFNELEDTVDGHTQTLTQHTTAISNKADGSTVTALTNRVSKNEQDISGINTTIGTLTTTVESKADSSTVETMSTKLNTVSDTVDGHTQSISSITSTQTTMQSKLDKTLVETTQLWFSKADTTAPNKPTIQVTSTAMTGNAWTTVVPAYNASYPNYYYCYQWKYSDGTYGWSVVTRDIAMGESQERARTAITNAANAQADIDGLEIGGRNLLLNTADFGTAWFSTLSKETTVFEENGIFYAKLWHSDSSSWTQYVRQTVAFELDTPYTLSLLVRKTNTDGVDPRLAIRNDRNQAITFFTPNTGFVVSNTEWKRYAFTINKVHSSSASEPLTIYALFTENNGALGPESAIQIAQVKLEKGNKATDWTPAPEDVDADILTAQTSADNAQSTADKNVKSSTQLWYTKANDTAPTKPASKITSTSVSGDGWRVVVPTYSASYPYYFYCWQYELADGTCTWSDVIYDRATTENQSNSRSAVTGVSTLTTKTNNIQDTVDGHTSQLSSITSTQTTIQGNAVKSTVQLWFTKANTTAPAKPTAHVTTNNAATGNAWNLAVPTYNASYPNYYYCYEYEYLNGTYGWSAVTRDIATGEMQATARQAQSDIDNLEIGGRNLLRNSLAMNLGASSWANGVWRVAGNADMSKSRVNISDGPLGQCYGLQLVGIQSTTSDTSCYGIDSMPRDIGEDYVISMFARVVGGGIAQAGFALYTANVEDKNTDGMWASYYTKTLDADGKWTRIWVHWKSTSSSGNIYIGGAATDSSSKTIQMCLVKIEKGTKPTDWIPAPEDVDADISTAQTSANNAQATADKNVKESQQLWFTKANGSAPAKPTAKVTSTSTSGNAWTTKVPTYNSSYPYYFYCMQYIAADGTVTWSDVVYDQATTEAQNVARTASADLTEFHQEYATFKQTTQQFESTIGETYATKTELGEAFDNRVDDSVEFLYRAASDTEGVSSGRATIKKIKGNTPRWNQLAPSIESASWHASQNTTASRDGGKITATVTTAGYGYRVGIVNYVNTVKGVKGHKYLVSYYVLCDKAANFGCDALNSGSVVLSACTAGVRSRIAGIFDYPTYEALVPNGYIYLCSMTSMSVGDTFTIDSPQLFDLTAMFGAGNEPATVAEFEALYPLPYYPYDPGSLLPVRMEGVETVGFNQWDEQWELGSYDVTNGEKVASTTRIRCKNPILVFPDTDYYLNFGSYNLGSLGLYVCFYDANGDFLSFLRKWSASLTTPAGAHYMTWRTEPAYGTTYKNDICINLSDPARNGTYEPYWSSERTIPASTYFPDGMRSAGSVADELRADAAITRVGAVDLGTLTWERSATQTSGTYRFMSSDLASIIKRPTELYLRGDLTCAKYDNVTANNVYQEVQGISVSTTGNIAVYDDAYKTSTAAAFKSAMSGVYLFYALATPTTTSIDPPLNLTYKVDSNGTERVMVDETQDAPQSAPLPMDVTYGVNLYESAGNDAASMASIESRVTTAETSITNNSTEIALRAKVSDVYTKTQTDGLISTEVANRDSAIQQSADTIRTSVSQTYATKTELSTTNGNVTALQNRNATLDAQYGYPYQKDIIVYGESNKYYPVYFTNTGSSKYDQYVTHDVMIKRGYAEQGPSDWNTSTHRGSLNLHFGWNYGGWGGATYKCDIYEFSEMYSTLLGDILVGADSGMFSIVYLRGGGTTGAIYHVYSDVPFIRHGYMTNAGVVGENDVPYVGLVVDTVYASAVSGGNTYTWKVRAPLTAPNVTHLTSLKTNTSMRFTLVRSNLNETQWASYSTIGHTDNWYPNTPLSSSSTYAIPDCRTLNVGDTFTVTGVSSDKSITHSIVCEVTAVPTTEHGSIPAKTIAVNDNSTYVKAVESRVSTAETSIQQNRDSIALKANSSDVYTKTQTDGLISTEVSNRNSAIEQSANAIDLSVSQTYTTKTEFNNLEIGGRNLLYKRVSTGGRVTANGDYSIILNASENLDTYFILYTRTQLVEGTTYVISCEASGINGEGVFYNFPLFRQGSTINGLTINRNGVNSFSFVMNATELGYHVASTVDNLTVYKVMMDDAGRNIEGQTGPITLTNFKLEKGNKSTDWTPAPEDMLTTAAFESARSEIQQTTDGITSTVEKISSAKYLTSGYSGWSLSNIKAYGSHDTQNAFVVTSTDGVRVGDTVYIKGTDTTRNCTVYIKGVVKTVNSATSVTIYGRGYEDILPVESIKSTINQSADSVKIEARHVNIEGAAIFSSGRLSETSLNNAYDVKGAAASLVAGGDNLIGGFNNNYVANGEYDYRTGKFQSKTTLNTADNAVILQYYSGTTPNGMGTFVGQHADAFRVENVGETCSFKFEKHSGFTHLHLKFNGSQQDARVAWDVTSIPVGTELILTFKLDSISSDGKGNGGVMSSINLRNGNMPSQWSLAPEDVEIGGRNLFVDTDRYCEVVSGSSTFGGENLPDTVIPEGRVITVSVEIDADNVVWSTASGQHRIGVEFSIAKTGGGYQYIGAWAGNVLSEGANVVEAFTGSLHKRVSKTFTLLGDVTVGRDALLYTQGVSSGTIRVGRVKVEYGTKATDWTPAPEDTDAAISAVSTVANNAAPKASAVTRTQRIYYRKSASGAPGTPGTTSSAWVSQTGNVSNAWTTMHVPISSTEKFIYTCEQRQFDDGNIAYTSVLLDNTITVIDGGNIITGTVSANAVNASSGTFDTANIPDLSAAKITSGDISADRIKANVISAINSLTAGQIDAGRINASQLSIGQSQVTNLTSDLADAKKHTQVIVSATNVDYAANTCTLTARLYIDGVLQTSTSLKWQWYRDGTTQGSQTTGATGSLAVTSSLGLAHRYACKCTF